MRTELDLIDEPSRAEYQNKIIDLERAIALRDSLTSPQRIAFKR